MGPARASTAPILEKQKAARCLSPIAQGMAGDMPIRNLAQRTLFTLSPASRQMRGIEPRPP